MNVSLTCSCRYAVEALPIWIIIGTVGGLAALSIVRAVHAPSVQWTSAYSVSMVLALVTNPATSEDNPTPWNRIKQDEGVKLLQVNQTFDKKCVDLFASYRILLIARAGGAETSTKEMADAIVCLYPSCTSTCRIPHLPHPWCDLSARRSGTSTVDVGGSAPSFTDAPAYTTPHVYSTAIELY